MSVVLESPQAQKEAEEIRSGPRRRTRLPSGFDLVALILGLVLAGLILYPIFFVLRTAFFDDSGFTVKPILSVLKDPALGPTLINTAIIAGVGTILAVLLASLFAWFNERTNAKIGWIARILPLLPLLIPGVAGAVGWLSLTSPRAGLINVLLRSLLAPFGYTGDEGPFNISSTEGLIFLYTIMLMPIAYVVVQPAFASLDSALEEAARVSGASAWRTLWRVTLPALFPSLTSGLLLTGIIALALFSVPIIIGTQANIDVVSTRVYRYLTFTYPPETGPAIALTFVVLGVTLAAITAQRWLLSRNRHAVIGGKGGASSLVDLGRWRWLARALMFVYLAVSAIIPFVGLLYLSFQRYWSPKLNFIPNISAYSALFAPNSTTLNAIINSLFIALFVATCAIVLATVLATFVARSKSRASKFVDAIAKLPATTSQLVLAVGVLLAFNSAPFFLGGTPMILFIGFLVLYIAYASFSANAAVGQIGNDLIEAASVSGAGQFRTFRSIQVPLMIPTLIGGWVLVFVGSIGDVTASALLGSPSTPVVGFEMLQLQQFGSFPQLAALGVIMTVVCVGAVSGVMFGSGRRSRAGAQMSVPPPGGGPRA